MIHGGKKDILSAGGSGLGVRLIIPECLSLAVHWKEEFPDHNLNCWTPFLPGFFQLHQMSAPGCISSRPL
jgi:hypothetical protein